MAVTAALLTSGASTTAVTPTSTASVSPTANDLLILAIHVTVVTSPISTPTITGLGLTWNLGLIQQINGVATRRVGYWYAQCGASPGSGAITVTGSGNAWSGLCHAVIRCAGHNTAAPINQTNVAFTGSNPLNQTLAAYASPGNRYVTIWATSNNSAGTITAPTDFTEFSENSYSTPGAKLWTGWNSAGTFTNPVALTEDSTYDQHAFGIEINEAVVAAPPRRRLAHASYRR